MNKYIGSIIGIGVAVIGAILFFDLKAAGKLPFQSATGPKQQNRWDELREALGNYSTRYDLSAAQRKKMDNDLWVSAAQRLGTSGDASARAYSTAQAFFKGIDLAPDGWELNINTILQAEFLAFAEDNFGITERSMSTGALL